MTTSLAKAFPFRFANGKTISQFSKPCIHCKTLVQTQHMHGRAVQIQELVFIDAVATCPHCRKQFDVACVISDDKAVHRIWFPLFIYRLQLNHFIKKHHQKSAGTRPRPTPFQNDETNQTESENQAHAQKNRPLKPVAVSDDGRPLPFSDSDFTPAPDSIGRFLDQDIPASLVDKKNIHFDFERTLPANTTRFSLADDEVIYQLFLVYKKRPVS